MIKVGVLSNPSSRRNRRDPTAVERVLADLPEVVHRLTEDLSPDPALEDLARQGVGLLVINGGDGTVQRVMTSLLERRPFRQLPLLALLRRGTANTTARNLGLEGRPAAALRRLATLAGGGDVVGRIQRCPVIRVENLANTPPQRAMFFGAAGVCDAIDFCDREIYARGIVGNVGMGLALLGLLARGRAREIVKAHDIGLALDGGPEHRSRVLLLIATTLERMILGSRPFWNHGGKAIRITSIGDPAAQLLRSTPKVLYGWRRHSLPEGYVSGGADRIEIDLGRDRRLTLDGEWFEAAAEGPLVLSAADQLEFVRLSP
jgi:diacylglycerol kinase (ATP)